MTRKKIIILGVVILLIGGFLAGFWPRWKGHLKYKEALKYEASLLAPYRADTYGGRTPEETWDMFLIALNKEDLELASKYFRVDDQKKWSDKLIALKNEDKLAAQIQDWESYKGKWNKLDSSSMPEYSTFSFKKYFPATVEDLTDGAGGIIRKNIPAGYYGVDVEFHLNPYTNIWKLESL